MSDIPIPLAIPNVGPREAAYVQQCFTDNWVSTVGPFVDRLERDFADLCGVPHGVAVAAGTMGLHAALVALGVGHGDIVILPNFTFIASANAISHAGARPWLFDVTEESWTLDPVDLEHALAQDCARDGAGVLRLKVTGERVAAVMPVYCLGMPADMDRIVPVAREYGLPVVADAAAAVGALYKGRPIGTLADASCFSFNGNKTITTGGGGMIVGPDAALMKQLKHITSTARIGIDYDHDVVGFNYRMTNIEAAMGCAQLERLDEFLVAKRRIRKAYDQAFAQHPKASLFPDVSWAQSAYWLSGLVLESGTEVERAVSGLKARNIMARKFWKPMSQQQPYLDLPRRPTPFADGLWARVLTLPCSTSLTEADQQRVIAAMRDVLG